ncbi:MAG TPA: long-chain fatty acid--CoA ligase [Acidimicrobiia bacterium]|nr:long-chain fatty acid--CoA ligase [Acidimicrobiia bacterium]
MAQTIDSIRADLAARTEGRTLPVRFLETVAARGTETALRWKDGDAWRELTWADYADQVARIAGALRGLGVRRGDRVFLMMRNRPEFHVADIAALFLGATPFSVYNSSAPDQVQYVVEHSGATVGIVEDIDYLERVLKVRGELPHLAQLAIIDDPDGRAPTDVATWSALLDATPLDLAAEAPTAQPSDLATIIYTSGTTGPPKGVTLDHANIMWTIESFRDAFEVDNRGWRAVSYLPMAHIAERMTSHYIGIDSGYEVTTCPDPAQVVPYLAQTHPHMVFAVPRVWEKAHAALQAAVNADPAKAEQFAQALDVGWQVSEHTARGDALPAPLAGAWEQVKPQFDAVLAMIGMEQVVVAVTGAAPIPIEILKFFRSLGLPLSEVYGLSETSGPMTWTPFRVKVGTVGPALPGVEVRLDEDGEVVCRGGNVFRGYLNAPDKTAEVLDDDGWFHSGDIGVLDDDGYLKIVDRKKELIITAGGKNISPANLEAALKAGALIGQVCVIGDNRPFISALVVLDPEVAPAWAKARGIEAATMAELAEHPDVRAEVEREVQEANARFSQAERIKRYTILHAEWLPDSEELTPTMKLKRRGVHTKYADEIDALYA